MIRHQLVLTFALVFITGLQAEIVNFRIDSTQSTFSITSATIRGFQADRFNLYQVELPIVFGQTLDTGSTFINVTRQGTGIVPLQGVIKTTLTANNLGEATGITFRSGSVIDLSPVSPLSPDYGIGPINAGLTISYLAYPSLTEGIYIQGLDFDIPATDLLPLTNTFGNFNLRPKAINGTVPVAANYSYGESSGTPFSQDAFSTVSPSNLSFSTKTLPDTTGPSRTINLQVNGTFTLPFTSSLPLTPPFVFGDTLSTANQIRLNYRLIIVATSIPETSSAILLLFAGCLGVISFARRRRCRSISA
ncbi:hypothetical protein K2X85_09345 [bacterium]|nr:hypothetical protein [bacterium]